MGLALDGSESWDSNAQPLKRYDDLSYTWSCYLLSQEPTYYKALTLL